MSAPGNVPCGSCHHCCKSELIAILPEEGDNPADFAHDTITLPSGAQILALKHKPNGDCIYLDPTGCSIHGRAPHICKTFDCRVWYRDHTRQQRRALSADHPDTKHVFKAGRQRLNTLDGEKP